MNSPEGARTRITQTSLRLLAEYCIHLLFISNIIVQHITRLSDTSEKERTRLFIRPLFSFSRSGESRHFGNSSFSFCAPFERDKCGTSWHSKIFRATRKSGINKRLPNSSTVQLRWWRAKRRASHLRTIVPSPKSSE